MSTGISVPLHESADLLHLFGSRELFVEPRSFRAWLKDAKLKAAVLASPQAVQDAIAVHAQRDVRPTMLGDIAVIDVAGPITYKSSWLSLFFGLASIEDLQTQFRMAMADATVNTIVFRVDSPGGVVDMMPEFAEEIFASKGRGSKQVIAVADTLMASCAYWLASQADQIYATTSSQIGAIGVFCQHEEISGMLDKIGIKVTLIAHGDHKVDANEYEPLSDAARADLQASVDEVGGWFDAAVARGRKVGVATVLEQFGQGKIFRGKQAIKLGLADKAGTFGQVIAGLSGTSRRSGIRGERSVAGAIDLQAGVVPKDVSEKLAPRDTPWAALTLADFTDQPWDSLSSGEKRHISGHFAWAASMPPESFGDLKLGHHRPSDGAVVFRGVTNALARLDQTKLPAGDAAKVRAHLERHEAAFEKQASQGRAHASADVPVEDPDDVPGCDECAPGCPCEQDVCPPECPDCSPDCACHSSMAKAEGLSAAERDALAIAATLTND